MMAAMTTAPICKTVNALFVLRKRRKPNTEKRRRRRRRQRKESAMQFCVSHFECVMFIRVYDLHNIATAAEANVH